MSAVGLVRVVLVIHDVVMSKVICDIAANCCGITMQPLPAVKTFSVAQMVYGDSGKKVGTREACY